MGSPLPAGPNGSAMSPQDLLAGAAIVHETPVPAGIVRPASGDEGIAGTVRLRPVSVGLMSLISRAARDDASLVPLLMIKEAMVEPAVTLEQVRQMHVGLVHFLLGRINEISGLAADGGELDEVVSSPLGRTHVLFARHFGWTPEQVAGLTPGQVAVYLAGVEKLLALDGRTESSRP
jgi:hypothetical protein